MATEPPFDYTVIHPPQAHEGWISPPPRPLTGQPKAFENGMSWEMSEDGWHRIVSAEGLGGDWAQYSSIATSPCGNYIAVSQYYAGCLPAETLVRIEPVRSTGFLPKSATLAQPTSGLYPIVLEVSAGPGTKPITICSQDEESAITTAAQAMLELSQVGAGASIRVLVCEDQAQHDRLLEGVMARVNVRLISSGLRRSADPRRNA